ncbi:hypothetical protein BSKO_07086 [Bryopsis sp. KO-2023]|nr:hypothetical protein BSKO_07086 [Bryopsis sp. KO-2023]
MEDGRVVLLVGLPCSGKTTFACNLEEMGWMVVRQGNDWHYSKGTLREAFRRRKNVVIDGENLKRSERRAWITVIREIWQGVRLHLCCVFIKTPIEVCVERLSAKTPNANEAINALLGQGDIPDHEEGFSKIRECEDLHTTGCVFDFLAQPRRYHPTILQRIDRVEGNHPAEPVNLDEPLWWQNELAASGIPGYPFRDWQDGRDPHLAARGRGRKRRRENGTDDPGPMKNYEQIGTTAPQMVSTVRPQNPPPPRPGQYLDENGSGEKITVLFDLNGTLTSPTVSKKSVYLRPALKHLLKLREKFRLGIFTSATWMKVNNVLPRMEMEFGCKHPFDIILHRDHTSWIKTARKGGKHWDTQKPLSRWFKHMHRVVLVDDDAWKAMEGEEKNMVVVPTWQNNSQHDSIIQQLVEAILTVLGEAGGEAVDVRNHTQTIVSMLGKKASSNRKNGKQGGGGGGESVSERADGDNSELGQGNGVSVSGVEGGRVSERMFPAKKKQGKAESVQDTPNNEEIPLDLEENSDTSEGLNGDADFIPLKKKKKKNKGKKKGKK